MANFKCRWTGDEFHYNQYDPVATDKAYRDCEAHEREYVRELERLNGRPLSYEERIGGFVKRKDTRDLIEKSKHDIWQPVKAKAGSGSKYDAIIANLNNGDYWQEKFLENSKIKDFRERAIADAQILRERELAEQAEQAASAERQESPQLKELYRFREEIRFNGNVDEREWSAIDRAIRQAEHVGGCELEAAALYEQAKAIRNERIASHNAAKMERIAALQQELINVATDHVDDSENPTWNSLAREAMENLPLSSGLSEVQESLASE